MAGEKTSSALYREDEREVLGSATKVSVSEFSDRTFVIVSQIGKIAAIVQVVPRLPQGDFGQQIVYDTRLVSHHYFSTTICDPVKNVHV
jgi:hypothetical protein